MPERSHLSIGEVLSLLRDEFPDVTISKIRFLESQGLVDPERTPSGYRKFYEHDVERLRWILRQQRENFLPLKVIRGRLSAQEGGDPVDGPLTPEEAGAVAAEPEPEPATRRSGGSVSTAVAERAPATSAPPHPEEPAVRPGLPVRPPAPTPSLFAGLHAADASKPPGAGSPQGPVPSNPNDAGEAGAAEDGDTYSAEELAGAVGADAALVHELKQYGLIAPHAVVAGVPYYDQGALAVVLAASRFARHGVEARHLRVWRNAADREADLYQQVVLPLLRQRNPQARRQALDTLDELTSSGAALRAALVDRAVREIR